MPGVRFPVSESFCFFESSRHAEVRVDCQTGGPPETVRSSYGHITVKAPHPIRTAKLSTVELDQYFGRGLQGNLQCCMAFLFFFHFNFFFIKNKKIRRGRFELPTKGSLRLRTLQSSALPLSYLRTTSLQRDVILCGKAGVAVTEHGRGLHSPLV